MRLDQIVNIRHKEQCQEASQLKSADSSRRPRLVIIMTTTQFFMSFRGYIDNLLSSGFDISVISSPRPEQEMIRVAGATIVDVPINREISPSDDLVSLWRLWRALRRLRPDITDCGTPKAGLLGGLAAVLAGVPCRIYTLHGLRLETTTGMKRKILVWAEWIACRCAHRVICVSQSLRQRAIDLGLVESAKTLVLANGTCHGVEVERFAGTAENMARAGELRRELNLPKDSLVIGFVGRLTRDKGIPELMEAYWDLRSDLRELRLLLVGDFEDGDPVPLSVRARIRAIPLYCGLDSYRTRLLIISLWMCLSCRPGVRALDS